MGRKFPVGENAEEIHPFISVSLFIAAIAATIAIVSSLCGALSRKKTHSSSSGAENQIKENCKHVNIPSPTDDHGSPSKDASLIIPPEEGSDSENATQTEESSQQPLPPPPGMRHISGSVSHHYRSNSTASTSSLSRKKLPTSMSMRALGNGTGIASRQSSKRDQDNMRDDHSKKKDKKLKHEDSIWKKTIILGEKCKVPDEDDDTILYDEKGNRISTYHRKSTSLALSRQGSNIDPDAIPSAEGHRDEILRIS